MTQAQKAAKTIKVERRGRPPRPGASRYVSGQISRKDRMPLERPDKVKATGLEARVRHNLGVDAWYEARESEEAMTAAKQTVDNPLLGSAIGRLLLVGPVEGISSEQGAAASYFGWLYRSAMKVKGWPAPNARAIGADLVGGKFYTLEQLDPDAATSPEHAQQIQERIDEVKSLWADMYRAIKDVDDGKGRVFEALKRVLIEDRDLDVPGAVGALRMGLNVINRLRA